jgi:hypothetical protein
MTPKRILVPLKDTAGDDAVLSVVAPAASAVGATLRLLHVTPVPHNLVSESGRVVMYADQEMERLNAHWLGSLAGSRRPFTTRALNASFGSATRRTRSSPRLRRGARRSLP